jgi:hypothetical protein
MNVGEKEFQARFAKYVEEHDSTQLDIGKELFEHPQNSTLYGTRAAYLLDHKWMQIPFGIFIVEYSIQGMFAYSHYSLNSGLDFIKYMEIRGESETTVTAEVVTQLFINTESFLHHVISNKIPPYYRNT